MAERFSKSRFGFDVDVGVSCTPCEEGGSKNRAVIFCSSCNQHFCTNCSKCHARFTATRNHTVIDVHANCQRLVKQATLIPIAKCIVHPDRNIEMYCGQHDMVYCALCVATSHRPCTGVKEITDALKPKSQSKLRSLTGKIDILSTKLQDSLKKKQRNIQHVESKEKKLTEEIEVECNLLIQHVDNLRKAAVENIKKTSEKVIAQIKEEISEAAGMDKSLQTCRSHLASSDKLSNSQAFIQQVLGQNTVGKAEILLSSLNSYESKHIEVDVNRSLRDSVLSATNIAQSKETTIMNEDELTKSLKLKNVTDVNVKVQTDTNICKITGITQLPDGTILVCDNSNMKLKRLDDQWTVAGYCTLDSEPWGVCCTAENEVAVKMKRNNVQFISVGLSLSETRRIKISGGDVLGIECIFGQLWVSQAESINVYSMSGTLLKNLVKLGSANFSYSPQSIAGSGETVYVSCLDNQVVSLDKAGRLKTALKDGRLGSARGVCVLKDGIVCTAGYDSNNIVMFGKDGRYLGELAWSGQDISQPWALCYDKKGQNLIVGCNDSNAIKVLSFDV